MAIITPTSHREVFNDTRFPKKNNCIMVSYKGINEAGKLISFKMLEIVVREVGALRLCRRRCVHIGACI